jgi:general nucleoside transport system ATP-binding protein
MSAAGILPTSHALALEVIGMSKSFGSFAALADVSMRIPAGTFHALLGENGAGKTTLVKCLVGYHQPDSGQLIVDQKEQVISSPQDANRLGIGMVYQHFTLVPSMTAAENLVMSRLDVPAHIRWKSENAKLEEFMQTVPFRIPLHVPVSRLAAGEKQKLEILKQLYLKRRLMILDEPTSVLTADEADEVLGMLKAMTQRREITVLMITHKFREVLAFADSTTILRKGRLAGGGHVADLDVARMAEMMVGSVIDVNARTQKPQRSREAVPPLLVIRNLCVEDESGRLAVDDVSLNVSPGEIVGVAGVSGNGQRPFIEALIGQRVAHSGKITVKGDDYKSLRSQIAMLGVFSLPEEPLKNACVGRLSVADNMALRTFDRAPLAFGPWVKHRAIERQALAWIENFKVKTQGPHAAISTLSGGNVQRAVLARELSAPLSLLIAVNPVFGLDFAAVREIHERILLARNNGAAVLLVSEDLDELLELSDRIVVMSEGKLVYETPTDAADQRVIGRYMAGHAEATVES